MGPALRLIKSRRRRRAQGQIAASITCSYVVRIAVQRLTRHSVGDANPNSGARTFGASNRTRARIAHTNALENGEMAARGSVVRDRRSANSWTSRPETRIHVSAATGRAVFCTTACKYTTLKMKPPWGLRPA